MRKSLFVLLVLAMIGFSVVAINQALAQTSSFNFRFPLTGDHWVAGESNTLTWSTNLQVSQAAGNWLSLSLKKVGDSTLGRPLSLGSIPLHLNTYTVPGDKTAGLVNGNDYYLKGQYSLTGEGAFNITSNTFEIRDLPSVPASINVSAPIAGAEWQSGQNNQVAWTSSGITGTVTIARYAESDPTTSLGSRSVAYDASPQSVSVTPTGSYYYKVSSNNNPSVSGQSGVFSVVSGGAGPGDGGSVGSLLAPGWHEPTETPPKCDNPNIPGCHPPLNVSTVPQTKIGSLTLDGLTSLFGISIPDYQNNPPGSNQPYTKADNLALGANGRIGARSYCDQNGQHCSTTPPDSWDDPTTGGGGYSRVYANGNFLDSSLTGGILYLSNTAPTQWAITAGDADGDGDSEQFLTLLGAGGSGGPGGGDNLGNHIATTHLNMSGMAISNAGDITTGGGITLGGVRRTTWPSGGSGTDLPTCTNGQVLEWNNGWGCGTDNTSVGSGGGTVTSVGAVNDGGLSAGSSVLPGNGGSFSTSGALSLRRDCDDREVLKWFATSQTWQCAPDSGGTGGGISSDSFEEVYAESTSSGTHTQPAGSSGEQFRICYLTSVREYGDFGSGTEGVCFVDNSSSYNPTNAPNVASGRSNDLSNTPRTWYLHARGARCSAICIN